MNRAELVSHFSTRSPTRTGAVLWRARWWVFYFPGMALHRVRFCLRTHSGPFHDGTVCLGCGTGWDHTSRKWRWFNCPDY